MRTEDRDAKKWGLREIKLKTGKQHHRGGGGGRVRTTCGTTHTDTAANIRRCSTWMFPGLIQTESAVIWVDTHSSTAARNMQSRPKRCAHTSGGEKKSTIIVIIEPMRAALVIVEAKGNSGECFDVLNKCSFKEVSSSSKKKKIFYEN